MSLHPVILAGGSGTRLWPLSRERFPKPLLPFAGERSMLQQTIGRLDGIDDVQPPLVVCNEEHRFLVAEQARELGRGLLSVILEPVGRNTAPALTLAALGLEASSRDRVPEDPVMLVMPADHVIRDVDTFHVAVRRGAAAARGGSLVTFGIVPDSPKTGYGYIKRGQAYRTGGGSSGEASDDGGVASPSIEPFYVDAFVEKPDRGTAESMLRSGDHLWNSGIFMMRVSVWLDQLQRHRPDIADACRTAHEGGGRDGDFFRADAAIFTGCPAESIDYAVMENAAGSSQQDGAAECVVLPVDVGWSDVGDWSALWELSDRDAQGNVVQGDVRTSGVRGSLLIGQHRLLAAVGLDDVIGVETADAVLIAHKDHVQDVKGIVEELKLEGRREHEDHRKVHRPWGTYETVDSGPRFQVKRLTVNPGAALSLQYHHHRAEHWVVVRGIAKVTRGDEEFTLAENESTFVPVGVAHRLANPGEVPLEVIEVQSGDYLGEDDIVRLEDRYGRLK